MAAGWVGSGDRLGWFRRAKAFLENIMQSSFSHQDLSRTNYPIVIHQFLILEKQVKMKIFCVLFACLHVASAQSKARGVKVRPP